jgi:hypothetical protein
MSTPQENTTVPSFSDIGQVLDAVAEEVKLGCNLADPSATISAKLNFDNDQVITSVENVTVNDAPVTLPDATIQTVQNLSKQIDALSPDHTLLYVQITIIGEQVDMQTVYVA